MHYKFLLDDKYHANSGDVTLKVTITALQELTAWRRRQMQHKTRNVNVGARRRVALLSQAKGQGGIEVGVEGCHGASQKR